MLYLELAPPTGVEFLTWLGGLVSTPWLAHREALEWWVHRTAHPPVSSKTPVGKEERQQSVPRSIKTQFVEQSRPVELSWRTGNLWMDSFIRIARRTVVSFLSPAAVQPLSSWQNKRAARLPKSNKLTSLLSSWEGAWRRSCTICPLTHGVSSAQLTTELGTTSRGRSSHGEDPSEIQWSETCQAVYVTSVTVLTRNSPTGCKSS